MKLLTVTKTMVKEMRTVDGSGTALRGRVEPAQIDYLYFFKDGEISIWIKDNEGEVHLVRARPLSKYRKLVNV